MHLNLTFFAGKSANIPCKSPLKKKTRLSIRHRTVYENPIRFFFNTVYTKLLNWFFNLACDFIERMITSKWLQKTILPYLRSRDWAFRMEAIFIHTRLDVGMTELWRKLLFRSALQTSTLTNPLSAFHYCSCICGQCRSRLYRSKPCSQIVDLHSPLSWNITRQKHHELVIIWVLSYPNQ